MTTRLNRLRSLKVFTASLFCAAVLFAIGVPAGAWSEVQKPSVKNPVPATDENIALGLDHYDAHCAQCHGSMGKGDSDKGKAVHAADLTSEAVQSKSDAQLFHAVAYGVRGSAMPAFRHSHSPDEIWHVILFVRKLPTLTDDERRSLEAKVPPTARHKHHEH
ncbi:MAG TPA: cytochrome c [Blastocatellia bacterium]|nr:cytochrome c [Blastocatellia bacterium]